MSEDNFKKILNLDGSITEPAKQSGKTGQRILGFGLQGTANEYAGELKINKDLISKNNKADINFCKENTARLIVLRENSAVPCG